jgi:hypothetical protein
LLAIITPWPLFIVRKTIPEKLSLTGIVSFEPSIVMGMLSKFIAPRERRPKDELKRRLKTSNRHSKMTKDQAMRKAVIF